MRKNKGITLIALVITIILLLILAGVVINLVVGEHGIINLAKDAGKNYVDASQDEQRRLDELYGSILVATGDDAQVNISMKDLKALIREEVQNAVKGETVTPTGLITAQMGNEAPSGYLKCDGSVYGITEYKQLAEYIKTQFGSYNYFGGDGETTFAVPDLRGEFLRGMGTASRDTGSGSEVGVHQDATSHMNLTTMGTGFAVYRPSMSTGGSRVSNQDKTLSSSKSYATISRGSTGTGDNWVFQYTSRPTNTSVLYCIKY